ncbi:MAG: hypothetical protein QXK80_02470 [Candidatus Pacearchaeota archaeon]
MNKLKICLVAHTENFQDNYKKFEWLVQEFNSLERELNLKIKINWMLEEDDTKPFAVEVRGNNRGDVITNGKDFFKKIKKIRNDELGIHVHFTKGWKLDFSYENQFRLLKTAKEKFVKAFGYEPRSFVGGWWYSDDNTLEILKKLKFEADASPLPLYRELRRKWLFGKIPLPFRVETCDWSNYKNRKPRVEGGILRVPNAVDPDLKSFRYGGFFSLDSINKYDYNELIQKFDKRNLILVIPFHPHSITKEKMNRFKNLLKDKEIKFLKLSEINQ